MSNVSGLLRALIIYGCCVPLAVVVGYLLATPMEGSTVLVVGILLLILTIPLFLRWHHPWLIATWNMSAVLFFLPGRPAAWYAMAGISLFIGLVQYAVNRNMRFLNVPSVTRPLLFLTAVVVITARLTGGIGLRAFGSQTHGGKNYFGIFAAVIGYFALISRPIPRKRAGLYVVLFFLGITTMAIGELPRFLPPGFNFLFLVFPVMDSTYLADQAGTSVYSATSMVSRFMGFGFMGVGVFCAMLARYGVRGVFFQPGKPWRLAILVFCLGLASLSGFRSTFLIVLMTFVVLFYLEGLHKTHLLPIVLLVSVLCGTLMVVFANKLPLSVQRSLAFLPVDIDPIARLSAETSTAWRLQMWSETLPEVPQYLIIGKGYGFSARDMAMIQDTRRIAGLEATELAGDYHNGPLSVIIPFGIFGVIGFVWFLVAAGRVLYQNYRYGSPDLRLLNTFLFAYFCIRIFFFFVIFGSLVTDLAMFAGLVGLSVSLNAGVAKPAATPQPNIVFNRLKLQPGVRSTFGA
jgi:hypothetical protein